MSTSIYLLVIVMGLVLLVGGIITGKQGATVIGIIVAGVASQQWLQRNRRRTHPDEKGS